MEDSLPSFLLSKFATDRDIRLSVVGSGLIITYQEDLPQSFTAMTMAPPYEDGRWYPNTGAMSHMTYDPSVLHQSEVYTGNDNVIVGDGSVACVFMGYASSHKGYRSLDTSNDRLYISRHVIFNEIASGCSVMEAKFFRFLKIVGVGFKARAESEGRLLYLKLGYSHEVELTVPPAVRVFCFKPNIVCCTGLDKQRVHQFAAAVRSCKPPEVYKGKGIMYIDEVIKKKQGKKSK
ncbi:hypothetical protein HHK36_002491 [Tetracentron sinense]|uniref:Ribosomal protein L6 n=1 Tax=Tetracentron sinense TaxID=13715 RepID=A0A834ZVN0_TETSI|nr:hypothetical protein HHK36_002491 [Tetracentron sinense]